MQFFVSLRWLKFGPSLYSRVRTLVADPSVPATLSVWQPEQCSTKMLAPAWLEAERFGSIPCSPQPAAPPAVAASAVAINNTRRALGIGGDSIGGRGPGVPPPC